MPNQYRRERIIREIAQRLSVIQKVNGYATDAGLALFHGPVNLGPDDPPYGIAIQPELTSDHTEIKDSKTIQLPVQLQAHVKDDLNDPLLMAESIIGDIKGAIESPEATALNLNGLAINLAAGDVGPLPRPEGSVFVGAIVTYNVLYDEIWGNPET